MTAQQNAQLQMYAALKATITAHSAAWTAFAPFASPLADFELQLSAVDAMIALQSTLSAGTTMGKESLRTDLEGRVLQMAASLVLYGKVTNVPQLSKDAHTTPSSIRIMSEKALIGHALKIAGLAGGLTGPAKTSVNISISMIPDLQSSITAFTDAVGTPRHKLAEAKRGTEELAIAIAAVRAIVVDQLDPAAEVLQYTQPAFYSEYRTARTIVDAGYSTRALTVRVAADGNGAPAAGITALITPGNIRKTTGATGRFYITNLAAGTYNMVLSGNSYQAKHHQFTIVDNNQPTVIELALLPQA